MPDDKITEPMLRQAFWNSVICTKGTKRLVAYAPAMGDYDAGTQDVTMKIFVPETPNDNFNLVLSLCEDGSQRVTVDWDDPTDIMDVLQQYHHKTRWALRAGVAIVTPSTKHWHLWGERPCSWGAVRDVLAAVGNTGYLGMNEYKGFATLRPPWENKHDVPFQDILEARFGRPVDHDMFLGVDWSGIQDVPEVEDDGATGWDDLFGEVE